MSDSQTTKESLEMSNSQVTEESLEELIQDHETRTNRMSNNQITEESLEVSDSQVTEEALEELIQDHEARLVERHELEEIIRGELEREEIKERIRAIQEGNRYYQTYYQCQGCEDFIVSGEELFNGGEKNLAHLHVREFHGCDIEMRRFRLRAMFEPYVLDLPKGRKILYDNLFQK